MSWLLVVWVMVSMGQEPDLVRSGVFNNKDACEAVAAAMRKQEETIWAVCVVQK